jgi:hypothetical protein
MKILLLGLLMVPFRLCAQLETLGSIAHLSLQNGFKQLVLGTETSLADRKMIYMDGDSRLDADSCLKFEYHDDELLKLDSTMQFNLAGLRTYKGKIVNVYLFFKKSNGYKVLSYFLNQYGLFTSKPQEYQNIYNWDTQKVSLSLNYDLNDDLGIAVFSFNNLTDLLTEKRKKRELQQRDIVYSSY